LLVHLCLKKKKMSMEMRARAYIALLFIAVAYAQCQASQIAISATTLALGPGISPSIVSLGSQACADSSDAFIQSQPTADSPATELTTVKMFTDGAFLYVLVRCLDSSPDKILKTLNLRDQSSGDRVLLYLSGTEDNETGYLFQLNAAGVQSDAFVYGDGRSSDFSWSGVWYSEVLQFGQGWVALFKIPFQTMRFKPGALWKVSLSRYIPRKNEVDFWPAMKVEQGIRLSSMAELAGIEPGRPGINLKLYPVALVKYDRTAQNRYSADGGADISWEPTAMSNLSLTMNPDFAQIESDPDMVNLGRYEFYYSERRPFFIEDAHKFQTPITLYYSRRIGRILPDGRTVPIYGAGKFISTFSRYNVAVLGALCGPVNFVDGDGNPATERQSFYPVVRVARGLGTNSSVGLFCGSRENGDSHERLYSVDGVWLNPGFQWKSQLAASQLNRSPGGLAYFTSLSVQKPGYVVSASSKVNESSFQCNGLGYFTFSGQAHQIYAGPVYRNQGPFQDITPTLGGAVYRLTGDPRYSKYTSLDIVTNLKRVGLEFYARYNWEYEMGLWYNFWEFSLYGWPNGEGKLSISPSVDYYNWTYNYRRGYFAPNATVAVNTSYKLSSNIALTWQANLTEEWKPDKTLEEATWIHEFWYAWSLTRDLHFKLYYSPDWAAHTHKANLLLSYNFSPQSWMYLAFSEGIDNSTGQMKTAQRCVTIKVTKLLWW
jgi:hypothetical protein